MYIVTEYQMQLLRNYYPDCQVVKEIQRQPYIEEKMGEWNGYIISNEYVKAEGKKFKIVFKSENVDEINKYCEEHEGCGIMEQYENIMYVCENVEMK